MEQYLHIFGSIPAPDARVILASLPESLAACGRASSGDEVLLGTDSEHNCRSHPCSGSVVHNGSLPQGHAVVWTGISRKRAKRKKQMRPELEHLIDRVLVPILVARYLNKLKHVNPKSEVAQ